MFQDLLAQLHSLVSDLEPWQQVLALVPVGAIPFIESYLGSFLGSALGIHPLLAIPAAVLGNLLATFGAIALSGRAREAVTRGRDRRATDATAQPSRFRQKIATALDRYGVPGVCLLGPFVVASQITAPTLVALGATRTRVYLWMGISIIGWGIVFGVFGSLFLTVIL
ncbi:hypothetical protein [Brachybacterium sp. FME24]|uniref:hypothetical protein n=1 Tax=Brachybacterium sp. FME24 TaxID=2742605 RepID=UPI0018678511|nr:hypothetical protein [Brachybacterium sp. FME24]